MKFKGRTARVGALIQEEIAKLITKGIKDPRIGFVSVMDVRMSKDLRYANVYVSLLGSESQRKSSLIGLQSSAGWVRREVGKYLHMRVLPQIRFFPDDTLDKVYHLEEVFEEIHAEQQRQPMLMVSPGEVVEALRGAESFYIAIHENPDGDAIGSMLGLRLLLQHLGKTEIICAAADEIPAMYASLPGAACIMNADAELPEYDLAVIVDCGIVSRIGVLQEEIAIDKRLLVLDHHLDAGESGAFGIVDSRYAATGELIAELYKAADVPFTPEAATCLYTAIATDTGCFKFSNTTARSHRLAGELMETGIDAGDLNKRFFSDMTGTKFELMRRALERVEFHEGGAIALSWLTQADLEEVGACPADAENLINYWHNIKEVHLAILLKSFDSDETRASFRSDSAFDSAAFLRTFDGGGHAAAAGATLQMPLAEARAEVLKELAAWKDSPWAS